MTGGPMTGEPTNGGKGTADGRVITGHPGIGNPVAGPALVARDNFSARYDLDRIAGTFSRPAHKLYGESYLDMILVLDAAKGGVATAWMLEAMRAMERVPLALLLNVANPIIAQGAAHADFPLIDRFHTDHVPVDITAEIRTGDWLEIDPAKGVVVVHDRKR